MKLLTPEEKEKIKDELLKKVTTMKCPMCNNKKFSMFDGYFVQTLQTDFKSVELGGKAIPTIGLSCTNCGFVSQHTLGVLGLLNKDKLKTDESE